MLQKITGSQIKGVRQSLNMTEMHRMAEMIQNKSFPKSSGSSSFGSTALSKVLGSAGSAGSAIQQAPQPQSTQQKDKPISRTTGNTHREISRPLDMFSQPLSRQRIAKTKAAESYKKGTDSLTEGESNNVLQAIGWMQSQMVDEAGIYNAANNRKLSINHG